MWKKRRFQTLSHPLDVKQVKTGESNVFGDLANQRIDFKGVQSNLQSRKNYRSENKRLEMEISMKNSNTKAIQSWFSQNSFVYNILKDLCQKFW